MVHCDTEYTAIHETQSYILPSNTQYTALHVIQYAEFQDQPVISRQFVVVGNFEFLFKIWPLPLSPTVYIYST